MKTVRILFSILSIFLIWIFISKLQLINEILLPTPLATFKRIVADYKDHILLPNVFRTILNWMKGFALGSIIGICFGIICGNSKIISEIFEFPIEFLRGIPLVAFVPILVLFFGVSDNSKVAVASTATFLLMTVTTQSAIKNIQKQRLEIARIFGATKLQRLYLISINEILPSVITGLRLGASLSLIGVVVTEMFIGSDYGIGQKIYDAYLTSSSESMYAYIIILGVLSSIFNLILRFSLERYTIWSSKC